MVAGREAIQRNPRLLPNIWSTFFNLKPARTSLWMKRYKDIYTPRSNWLYLLSLSLIHILSSAEVNTTPQLVPNLRIHQSHVHYAMVLIIQLIIKAVKFIKICRSEKYLYLRPYLWEPLQFLGHWTLNRTSIPVTSLFLLMLKLQDYSNTQNPHHLMTAIPNRQQMRTSPVSYTHLDVYKRQL